MMRFDALARLQEENALLRARLQACQSELAVLRGEARYRSLVDLFPDAILINQNGVFVFANPAAIRLWGANTVDELLGKTPFDLIHADSHPIVRERLARLAQGERVPPLEEKIQCLDGATLEVEISASPFEAGLGPAILVIARDISERKRAEARLRKSEQRFRRVVESRPVGVFFANETGEITDVNDTLLGLLGYTRDELIGRRWSELTPPEYQARDAWAVREVRERGTVPPYEKAYWRKDGSRVHILIGATLLEGEPREAVAFVVDITALKQTEQALRQSNARFARAEAAVNGFLYEWDVAGGRVFRSEGLARMLGIRPADVSPDVSWWHARIHPEDHAPAMATLETWLTHGAPESYASEYRIRHEDGHYLWVWDRASILSDEAGRPVQLIGTTVDITERKQTEAALQASERLFRTTFENGAVGITHFGLDGRFLRVNDHFCQMLGYAREELLVTTWQSISHPAEIAQNLALRARHLRGEIPHYTLEKRYFHKDGSEVWVNLTASALRDERGQPQHLIAFIEDIGPRKRAEQALRASEERYRNLLNKIDQGFCLLEMVYDTAGRAVDYIFLEVNPTFESHTGLRNAVGQSARRLVPGLEQHWVDIYAQVAQTGETQRFEQGSLAMGRLFEVEAARVGAPEAGTVALLFRDITERKRRETNLALLSDVTEAVSQCATPEEMMAVAGEKIGAHLRVQYCHFMSIDEARDEGVYLDRWHADGVPPLPDQVRLSDHVTEAFLAHLHAGRTVVSEDAQADPITRSEANASVGVRAFVTVPFHIQGEWRHLFSVHDIHPRHWGADEVELVRELANRLFPRLERARAEAALRESEARYRFIVENTGDAVFRMGLRRPIPLDLPVPEQVERVFSDAYLLACNEGMARMYGFETADDMIGRPMVEFMPRTPENEAMEIALAQAGFRVVEAKTAEIDRRGQAKFMLTNVVGRIEDGHVVDFIGAARDITERELAERALRASEERFRSIVETANEGFWLLNSDGDTLFANEYMLELVGRPADGMLGRGLTDFCEPGDLAVMRAHLAASLRGESELFDFRLRRIDGSVVEVLVGTSPVRDGQGAIIGVLGAFTDITERKRAADHARFLAEASKVLARSLDYETTLQAAVRAAVPALADDATIWRRSVDGLVAPTRVGVDFADPMPLARLLQPVRDAFDGGGPRLVVPGPARVATQILVPLFDRYGTFGVLELTRADPAHRYGPADLALAQEFGRRVALAAENARLYVEAQAWSAALEQRVAERTKALEHSQERLRQLSAYQQRMLEKERTRIAQEIHDEMGGTLTGVKMMLARLRDERDSNLGQAVLNEINGLIEETVQAVRRIAAELRPAVLDSLGLLPALEWQAEEFEKRTGIVCSLDVLVDEAPLSEEVSVAVFRVFQEALTNIARHAQATRVVATLDTEDAQLVLVLHDNGRGLQPEAGRAGSSLGLLGMRERIEQVAGTFQLDSTPGAGTTIAIRVPLLAPP